MQNLEKHKLHEHKRAISKSLENGNPSSLRFQQITERIVVLFIDYRRIYLSILIKYCIVSKVFSFID